MRGYPRCLATKSDYDAVKELYPEKYQAELQTLYSGKSIWTKTGDVAKEAAGVTDATHKVIPIIDAGTLSAKVQLTLVDDPNCKLLRIGYTVKDVEDLLAIKEAKITKVVLK